MPWEKREYGDKYYYKSVRIDGKPRRMYLGFGPAGRIHAVLDRQQERKKRAIREEREAINVQVRGDNRSWSEISAWVRLLTASSLLVAGRYFHHGEWRPIVGRPRKRQATLSFLSQAPANDLGVRLATLNAQANAGLPGAVEELTQYLHDSSAVWPYLDPLIRSTMERIIARVERNDSFPRKSIGREVDSWKRGLLGSSRTRTERALVEIAAIARLMLLEAESAVTADGGALPIVSIRSKRLDRAQHRLVGVLKSLSQVQRGSRPLAQYTRPRTPHR